MRVRFGIDMGIGVDMHSPSPMHSPSLMHSLSLMHSPSLSGMYPATVTGIHRNGTYSIVWDDDASGTYGYNHWIPQAWMEPLSNSVPVAKTRHEIENRTKVTQENGELMSITQLMKRRQGPLQRLCLERGLPMTGLKRDLVKRIIAFEVSLLQK